MVIRVSVSAAAPTRELHGRTPYVAIGAEDAAVTVARAEYDVAAVTLVKEGTRVGRHLELLAVPAFRTGERRAGLHRCAGTTLPTHGLTTVAVYLSVATAAIIWSTVTVAESNVTTARFFS